ncbi:MAG: sodium/proline symporter, partial [Eubacteriales bacterium]|nr:sodium/proline symporter [Eubacteriales bacterium]
MLIMIVLYLLGMVLVGALLAKKNNSAGDFYLGGRQLGPYVTAMSAEASDMSSWLLMGIPGLAYFCGISDAAWTCIGLVVGTYLNWLIVARRLRNYSERLGAITIPDFFRKRFHSNGKALQAIAAVLIIVFFVPYTASGFAGCGKLFSSLLGVDYIPAMLISALVIVLYTTLGGFLAASITDFIQSLFMTVALLAVLIFGTTIAGGMDRVMENARSVAGYLDLTKTANVVTGQSGPYSVLTIVSTLAWGLGYFGMPHILLRFMAIRQEKELTLSRRIATIWVVISMAIAIAIGVIGYSVSVAGKVPFLTTSSDSETIIIQMADLMSRHGVLLIIAAGIIISGILAATMSTADSQLLAAASSVSQDLMQDFFHVKLT